MTDLDKYKELFRSTLLEFKETTFKVRELDGFQEINGVVENTGEVIKLEVPIYKELVYTALEPYSFGDGSGSFNFDENGKFHNFRSQGEY